MVGDRLSEYRPCKQQTATLLPNGTVLVAGGSSKFTTNPAIAELYNPSTGKWSETATQSIASTAHTATLLPNGMVLVAGGNDGISSISDAEPCIILALEHGWLLACYNSERDSHTATLLPSGQILITGGRYSSNNPIQLPPPFFPAQSCMIQHSVQPPERGQVTVP